MVVAPPSAARYRRPNWVERRIVSPILTYFLKHFGLPVSGTCVLSV